MNNPKQNHMNRIRLALHNLVGHPLMEIAYILGLRQLGNYIHNNLFRIDHEWALEKAISILKHEADENSIV